MKFLGHLFWMTKKSIRQELDKAKELIEKGKKEGNVSDDFMSGVNILLSLFEVILTIFLEKKTRKNSGNSGIPPSQDTGSKNDRNGDREQKGKKGSTKGECLDNVHVTTKEETVSPQKCSNCGNGLKFVEVAEVETRKKIDIFYEVVEESVNSEHKKCPNCETLNKGEFPKEMDGPLQYGTGVKTAAVNFLMVQMMSMNRVREYFRGVLGRKVSPAALLRYVTAAGNSIIPWQKMMIEELLKAPVIYVDETSIKINGKIFWIHTYGYGDITLQFLHPSRGMEAIEDIGILTRYRGIIVHDCLGSYFTLEGVNHGLCNGHLLRELRFVEEDTGAWWATRMKKLLKKAIKKVAARKEKVLSKKEQTYLNRRYEEILLEGLWEMPDFPLPIRKKGRPKHTKEQNLWMRLFEYRDMVLLFTRVAEVDATNNRAERDLRMSKVKQKVCGCFRTQKIAEHYCAISGYVKTMKRKGYSAMEAIAMTFLGSIPINSS